MGTALLATPTVVAHSERVGDEGDADRRTRERRAGRWDERSVAISDDQSTSGPRTRDLARHVPAAVLTLILLAFAIDNRHKVTVGFVFTDEKVPLVVVLVATALIGAVIGALLRRTRHR
jgi:uncharacterized integral membrane protein